LGFIFHWGKSCLILKILYLAHRIPYPPNKGDKIRSFNEIKYLSQRHEIHLACLADQASDIRYSTDLGKYCTKVHVERLVPSTARIKGAMSMLRGRPLSVGYFYSKPLQQVVNRWIEANRYDGFVCFSSPMAEYLFRSPVSKNWFSPGRAPCPVPRAPRSSFTTSNLQPATCKAKLIIDFCDVDSDKWRQYACESTLPAKGIYLLESRRLLRYERRVNRVFDYSVFVSKPESELFLHLNPEAKGLKAISNGVDHTYFSPNSVRRAPCALSRKTSVLLFTGAMDYHANIDGVTWFCKEIFPLIKEKNPSAEFYIVGSNPTAPVKRLAEKPGIKVTGFVEDIRPYYSSADVCVIPLRLARGIQNKVLEGMSMARSVVATAKALEGIGATPGEHVLVADDASAIGRAVGDLLNNEEKRKALGQRARDFVVSKFDWSANMKLLEALFQG
jgi:polysaccharide biosynthesis protein PslH